MNLKEIHIINSLLEQSLIKYEIEGLKERLRTLESYNAFSEKLMEIIIGKNSSTTLLDFLTHNGLSDKFLSIQNKTVDVIEELAELHFKGFHSDYTDFLLQSNNEVFLNHLHFLRETKGAFTIKERIDLKKKFEKLGKLNEFSLEEKDIKSAVNLIERKRLKQHLAKLQSEKNLTTKIIAFDFKVALKYAAILVLVVGPAIFIINRINNAKDKELADKHVKTVRDSLPHDTIKSEFQLPVSEKFSGESLLLEERKFGFSSNNIKKIDIVLYNISEQLSTLEIEQKRNQTNGATVHYLKHAVDSLNAIKETYTFDEKEGKIYLYSTKLKADKKTLNDLKVLALELENKKAIYLKVKNNYYKLLNTGKNNSLHIELNEDVIDRLNLIEKQND